MELSTVIDYGDGDKTTLRRDAKKTIVLRFDTRNKKLIVDDAIEQDIIIQDNSMSMEMIHKVEYEDERVKDAFVTYTMISPPYAIRGTGKTIFKQPLPGLINSVIKGDCIKIDSTEFDQFLNQ